MCRSEDDPLEVLVDQVLDNPQCWEEVVCRLQSKLRPRFQQDLAVQKLADRLVGGKSLGEPPRGFVRAALLLQILARPKFEQVINALAEGMHDAHGATDSRLMEVRIHVGKQALQYMPPDATADCKAFVYSKLGIAYAQLPFGDRCWCQENAIECFEKTRECYEEHYDPKTSPADWSQLQNNLGCAYKERLNGPARRHLQQPWQCIP